MEEQRHIAESVSGIAAGAIPQPRELVPSPRGTFTGAALAIAALLLSYAGAVRLFF